MNRSSDPLDSRSSGQALVEFALIAPLLFLLLLGIFEAGRFLLYLDALNNAAREGARYAIVHGERARDACPSGPMPPATTYSKCTQQAAGPTRVYPDDTGENVKRRVVEAAAGLASSGDLFVADPCWTLEQAPAPIRGDTCLGHNGRGQHVTVWVDYTYDPIVRQLLGSGSPLVDILPRIPISVESTLVVHN